MKKYLNLCFGLCLLFTIIILPKETKALSCLATTFEDSVKNSDVIFTGVVKNLTYTDSSNVGSVTFEVKKVWKGDIKTQDFTIKASLSPWPYSMEERLSPSTIYWKEGTEYLINGNLTPSNVSYPDSNSSIYKGTSIFVSIDCNFFLGEVSTKTEEIKKLGKPIKTFGNTTSPINPAPNYLFTKDLSLGMTGPDVAELQNFLILRGYDIPSISSGINVKGYFGGQTKAAVMKYQRDNGVLATGFVGPLTREKLNGRVGSASIKVSSPNGGENLELNENHLITWNSNGIPSTDKINIYLIKNYSGCFNAGTRPCLAIVDPELPVAKNIENSGTFNWKVGKYLTDPLERPSTFSLSVTPSDNYYIKVCMGEDFSTRICDTSDAVFSINKEGSSDSNRPPVISGIEAPTTLKVGEMGTWKVKASDPENKQLNYSVIWGDDIFRDKDGSISAPTYTNNFVQNSTFTHSYSKEGEYTVRFTVRDNSGGEVTSSVGVKVGNTTSSIIKVVSPNGGEKLPIKSTKRIEWEYKNKTFKSKVDIYLVPQIVCIKAPCIANPIVLDKKISTSRIYNWIVGTDTNDKAISTGNYKMRICVAGTNDCDESDGSILLTEALLRACPTEKIVDEMPGIVDDNFIREYYIYEGARREIIEFDKDYVSKNCNVPVQTVY